jgi:hypothetical protein
MGELFSFSQIASESPSENDSEGVCAALSVCELCSRRQEDSQSGSEQSWGMARAVAVVADIRSLLS